jgi:cAMP phosphodiesterase
MALLAEKFAEVEVSSSICEKTSAQMTQSEIGHSETTSDTLRSREMRIDGNMQTRTRPYFFETNWSIVVLYLDADCSIRSYLASAMVDST